MPTYRSLFEYRKVQTKRLKAIKKAKMNSELKAASFMVAMAKKLAPRKTGATIRGIRKRKTKQGYTVESWVPGSFKQNLFANQTAPYRTVTFEKTNKYFAGPQNVIYGHPAKSPSGRAINWTGTPRFFHFAALRSKKFFRKMAVKNTRKALRVSI